MSKQEILWEGTVYKRSRGLTHNWQQRHMILFAGGKLGWTHKSTDTPTVGSAIVLGDATDVTACAEAHSKVAFGFMICLPKRDLHISIDSKSQRSMWISRLSYHVKIAKLEKKLEQWMSQSEPSRETQLAIANTLAILQRNDEATQYFTQLLSKHSDWENLNHSYEHFTALMCSKAVDAEKSFTKRLKFFILPHELLDDPIYKENIAPRCERIRFGYHCKKTIKPKTEEKTDDDFDYFKLVAAESRAPMVKRLLQSKAQTEAPASTSDNDDESNDGDENKATDDGPKEETVFTDIAKCVFLKPKSDELSAARNHIRKWLNNKKVFGKFEYSLAELETTMSQCFIDCVKLQLNQSLTTTYEQIADAPLEEATSIVTSPDASKGNFAFPMTSLNKATSQSYLLPALSQRRRSSMISDVGELNDMIENVLADFDFENDNDDDCSDASSGLDDAGLDGLADSIRPNKKTTLRSDGSDSDADEDPLARLDSVAMDDMLSGVEVEREYFHTLEKMINGDPSNPLSFDRFSVMILIWKMRRDETEHIFNPKQLKATLQHNLDTLHTAVGHLSRASAASLSLHSHVLSQRKIAVSTSDTIGSLLPLKQWRHDVDDIQNLYVLALSMDLVKWDDSETAVPIPLGGAPLAEGDELGDEKSEENGDLMTVLSQKKDQSTKRPKHTIVIEQILSLLYSFVFECFRELPLRLIQSDESRRRSDLLSSLYRDRILALYSVCSKDRSEHSIMTGLVTQPISLLCEDFIDLDEKKAILTFVIKHGWLDELPTDHRKPVLDVVRQVTTDSLAVWDETIDESIRTVIGSNTTRFLSMTETMQLTLSETKTMLQQIMGDCPFYAPSDSQYKLEVDQTKYKETCQRFDVKPMVNMEIGTKFDFIYWDFIAKVGVVAAKHFHEHIPMLLGSLITEYVDLPAKPLHVGEAQLKYLFSKKRSKFKANTEVDEIMLDTVKAYASVDSMQTMFKIFQLMASSASTKRHRLRTCHVESRIAGFKSNYDTSFNAMMKAAVEKHGKNRLVPPANVRSMFGNNLFNNLGYISVYVIIAIPPKKKVRFVGELRLVFSNVWSVYRNYISFLRIIQRAVGESELKSIVCNFEVPLRDGMEFEHFRWFWDETLSPMIASKPI